MLRSLFKKQIVFLAATQMFLVSFFQFSYDVIVHPRYLAESTVSKTWTCRVVFPFKGYRLFPVRAIT